MPLVSSGVEHGNLRELALARMKDLGTQVKDQQPYAQEELPADYTVRLIVFVNRRRKMAK